MTELASVVVVTWVPGLVAISVKSIVNGIFPSPSVAHIVSVALQVFPPILDATTTLVAIVTVGVFMISDAVNVSVTISHCFAYIGLALLEIMFTAINAGGVISILIGLAEASVLGFPSASSA